NFIRLDNRAPDITTVAPTYVAGTQNTANGWVGKNFIFSVAAGSLTGGSATADNQVAITAISPNSTGGGGVDKVTLNTQWAPQGTSASSTAWATFTSVTSLAETPAATGSVAYDLRLNVCDALGNCVATPTLATFGVDLTPPTATTASGPKANEIDGIGQTLTGGGSVSVSASDPQGANLVAGSGFGSNPVLVSETRLFPSGATGQTTSCTIGTPNTAGTACASPSAQPLTFAATTTSPGQYALTYTVTDQAGNQSAPVALNYYLDQTAAPQMTGGIGIPASITAGAVFTASGTDDMDFAAVNAYLNYPGVARVVVPGTSSAVGVAFDNTLTRASTATVTLSAQQFYRSLGVINAGAITVPQTKPDRIGIRGLDAANNLAVADVGLFPATNISTPTTLVIGTDLNDFAVSVNPTTVSNGNGTVLPRSTTITATVTAVDANHGTPFSQVCFYIINPTGAEGAQADPVTGGAGGELSLLGCTAVNSTTLVGTNKLISSTMSFDPDAKYGTASTLNIVAVGVTANGDALVTGTAAGLTLVP
ncbi:MAG TPA: hypothetical protein VF785_03000, partial [Gemmatimonadaceae bacterium]